MFLVERAKENNRSTRGESAADRQFLSEGGVFLTSDFGCWVLQWCTLTLCWRVSPLEEEEGKNMLTSNQWMSVGRHNTLSRSAAAVRGGLRGDVERVL
jgi:hypothetical protein